MHVISNKHCKILREINPPLLWEENAAHSGKEAKAARTGQNRQTNLCSSSIKVYIYLYLKLYLLQTSCCASRVAI